MNASFLYQIWRFLRSNELEQLDFKLENMQEKLESTIVLIGQTTLKIKNSLKIMMSSHFFDVEVRKKYGSRL